MMSNIIRLRSSQAAAPTRGTENFLSEAFATTASDAGVIGYIVSHLGKSGAPLLWVQDRLSCKETGKPYLPGHRHAAIIHVHVNRPVDVLWAMEEGLRCKALSAVVGEVWGDPPVLDFTATKRLAMRAEAHNLPCWLIRRATSPNLSAARDRWRIASIPSLANPHDPQAPGDPRWQAELFRSRSQRTGTWIARYDRAADRLNLAAPLRDGSLATGDGTAGQRTAR